MLVGVIFFTTIALVSAALVAWYYWKPMFERDEGWSLQWFCGWAGKSLVAPAILWLLVNGGAFWKFGPFMPQVSMAQVAKGRWEPLLAKYAMAGVFIIASYWVALSLGWVLILSMRRVQPENRSELKFHTVVWSVLGVPIAALIFAIGGWPAAGLAATVWFVPLAHSLSPLAQEFKLGPSYSGAMGKLKFGRFKEAEMAILEELEQAEDDFEGWMMLAELYAKHFKDLDAADQTVRDLCAQPNLNASQVVTALHRLADWHLNLGENPEAAREVLEVICKAYPGTHLARMAQLRINQLPKSRKELASHRQVKTVRLPALREGEPEQTSDFDNPQELIDELVGKLKENPDDISAREKLATIFAEGVKRIDLGIQQLELLLEMPNQSEGKCAQWLSQIASWQLRTDKERGRRTLQRLIQEYPRSAQAFAAQRRLLLMEMEQRFRPKQPVHV